MNSEKKIQVFADADKLFEATANQIIEMAYKAIEARGQFVIALSGGNTPEQLYILLSKDPFSKQMPWKQTFVFWGDERCVPFDDKQNNARMAKELLLNKVDIPAINIYPVPVNLSPADAANKYEKEINIFFKGRPCRFDLVLLGLGENGHTASLFPGTGVLLEKERLVKEVFVEEQNMFRVTMTAPLINQAHHIIFLVTGKQKAAILKKVLGIPYMPDKYPAQLIKPGNGELFWFTDNAAADI